jgi:hypothetical protein
MFPDGDSALLAGLAGKQGNEAQGGNDGGDGGGRGRGYNGGLLSSIAYIWKFVPRGTRPRAWARVSPPRSLESIRVLFSGGG